MSAPAANARSPAPVMTMARQAGSRSSVSSAVRELIEEGEAQGVERMPVGAGSPTRRRAAGAREPPMPAPELGTRRGRSAASVSAVAPAARVPVLAALEADDWAVLVTASSSSVQTVSTDRGSGGVHLRRVLEHEERGQSRRDLAQVPAGGPHRVRARARRRARPGRRSASTVTRIRSRLARRAPRLTRRTRVSRRPGVPATSGRCSSV